MENSALSNNNYGVLIERSSSISISNNVVSDTTQTMLGAGVQLDNCTKVSVVNNQIHSATFGSQGKMGLVINYSPDPIISNNQIWYRASAVSLDNSANALLTGNNASYNLDGLNLVSSPRANITDNLVAHNGVAIYLGFSDNSSITSNVVYHNTDGIQVYSNNATISKNVIALNAGAGIRCCFAKVANIRTNNFTGNGLFLTIGFYLPYVSLTITPDNLVNGKPLRFYSGCSNLDINGIAVGELILMNCNNVRITNLEIYYAGMGIQLFNVNNTLIISNSINSNMYEGISLIGFVNITVTGNNLSNNGEGSFRAGLIADPFGLRRNDFGVSTELVAYHNNFFYDPVIDPNSYDHFDNGYPSGGNYWSQYRGLDNCSGPSQNICPNPDGIGDSPFSGLLDPQGTRVVIDHYPLMRPYVPIGDIRPPSWLPNTQLIVSNISQTSAILSWMGAADDVAVVSYQAYEGSTLIANISADPMSNNSQYFSNNDQYLAGYGYQYVVGNLSPGTTYTFKIVAVDEAGNQSLMNLTARISTQPTPPPPPFSVSWWQQNWYFIALPAGAGTAALVFLLIRRRKRVLASSSITTSDSSNLGRRLKEPSESP